MKRRNVAWKSSYLDYFEQKYKEHQKYMDFFPLKVKNIYRDTAISAIIELELPEELSELMTYRAGQYITVLHDDIRRSYSICSVPEVPHLKIGVKKVEGGKMSTYLVDKLKKGDTLKVSRPEGNFIPEIQPEASRYHFFIAAGSGITPVIAMIQDILNKEPLSTVNLLYSNKMKEITMFYEDVGKMSDIYKGQFNLNYTFTRENKKFGMFKNVFNFNHFSGRIDRHMIKKWLDHNPSYGSDMIFYLCGPGKMIDSSMKYLLEIGVPKENIKTEYFTTDHVEAQQSEYAGIADVTVHLYGDVINLQLDDSTTILEAVEDAGYDPPFSCRDGSCCSCVAELKEGDVIMDKNLALSNDDLEKGYILTCQSRVNSSKIELVYE